ncbi:MAG: hypothetical protein KCHDKBKB_02681 [Elusimicrobia bacterium]|nr:hypothetical protein [Elusimicrobiota bacterium]
MSEVSAELISRIYYLGRLLKTTQFILEIGDVESSAFLAKRYIDEMFSVIEQLKNVNEFYRAHFGLVLDFKMPKIKSDRIGLQEMTGEHGQKKKIKEESLEVILVRCFENHEIFMKEFRKVYPLRDQWYEQLKRSYEKKIKKHKGRIVLGGLLLIFLVGGMAVKFSSYRKKFSLIGQYYYGTNFENLFKIRHDDVVNFRWGIGAPTFFGPIDDFSVRWTGFLLAPLQGEYEFSTLSDDGVKLWIDDILVIDNWTAHPIRQDVESITLTPGYHAIRLEYFEGTAGANMQLFWKRPDATNPVVIQSKYFISEKKYLNDGKDG